MGLITLSQGANASAEQPAVKAGDGADEAFAALYEAHRNLVYRTALAILGQHEIALDAVQETFIKVHRGLSQWRGESALSTWIVRIAVRCAIDLQRQVNRRRETGEAATEPFDDPRLSIEKSLQLARLRSVADRLPGQAGIILRLRLFGGQSSAYFRGSPRCRSSWILRTIPACGSPSTPRTW